MDNVYKLLPIVCCGECKHSTFNGEQGDWRCWEDAMIPTRAHNPHPPTDSRHGEFNKRKTPWDYKRLDSETFKALAYSHKMKVC